MTRTIPAGKFKAQCLKLMDEVAATGEPIVITKRGVPKARLIPEVKRPKRLFGFMKGQIEIVGDIISPIDIEWEAMKGLRK